MQQIYCLISFLLLISPLLALEEETSQHTSTAKRRLCFDSWSNAMDKFQSKEDEDDEELYSEDDDLDDNEKDNNTSEKNV